MFTTKTNETEEPANKNQQSQQELFYEVAELINKKRMTSKKNSSFHTAMQSSPSGGEMVATCQFQRVDAIGKHASEGLAG